MALTLYGLKTCDTCRKAMKALEAAGKKPRLVDLRAETDLPAKVPAWHQAVGAALLNRSSTTWRSLDEAQKARAESDPVALLIEHPTLIKRPVIETGEETLVGWRPEVRDHLLK